MENATHSFFMAISKGALPLAPILIIFLLLTIALTMIRMKRSASMKRGRLPPGRLGLPIFGCLIQMLLNKPTFRWIHKMMEEMNTEIACIRLGHVHLIPVSSPELAREFFKKHDKLLASRPDCMSARVTGNGYLMGAIVSPGDEQWKKMRKVLTSDVLSLKTHCWLQDKRTEEADNLIRYVYNRCKKSLETGGVVNVRNAAQHYCGDVTRHMVFNKKYFGSGKEDGGPGPEEEEHVAAIFTILSLLYSFAIADYVPCLEIFDFDGHKRRLQKAVSSLNKFHDPEIDSRIDMWKNGSRTQEDDILDVLINLKDKEGAPLLTTKEIKAQIIEIMIATVDNPSNAAEWALAEMINQPQILIKASQELDEVVGKDRLVQESDLRKLNYVNACAKEAFRLHPVAPFIPPRVSMEDTTVEGYFIPKGSHVLLSRRGLGRNPRIWEDPLVYKPERHLKDDGSQVLLSDLELTILSFSTGRRGCPGVLLGSTMTTMLLARLVQGFSWSIPADMPNIKLTKSMNDKPLVAAAKPRLSINVYQQLEN